MKMEKHILYDFTAEDHRRRLENIMDAERQVKACAKKELILDYEPGHYIYPGNQPDDPEKDEKLFRELAAGGVKYIYLWSAWAALDNRWNGTSMFTPQYPEKTRAFLQLAHQCGLKVLPYTSTNFFTRSSALFDPNWAYASDYDLLLSNDFALAHCSPTSPGWRGQLLHNYKNLLDSFDYDGVYVDSGYIRRCDYLCFRSYYEKDPVMVADEIPAFPEDAAHDGGMEDLLSLIRAEVKRRGGTFSVFKEGVDRFRTSTELHDYMFAGECATDIDYVRETVRDYKHVLLDFSPEERLAEMEYYLNTIPFLHFPLVKQKAITVANHDAIIPDYECSLRWLRLFRKMTREGTYFYMDAEAPGLVCGKGSDTVCSLYVNDESYLVLANFGASDNTLTMNGRFSEITPEGAETPVSGTVVLKSRELKILKKIA